MARTVSFDIGQRQPIAVDDPYARRRIVAEQLLAQSLQPKPVQSVPEGLLNLAETGVNAFFARRARREEQDRDKRRNQLLADALQAGAAKPAETRTYGTGEDATTINWNARPADPNMVAQMLLGAPETAEMGSSMMLSNMQAEQDRAAQLELLRAKQAAEPETFGAPEAVVGPDGKPMLVRFGNRGGQQPVDGLRPYVDPTKSASPAAVQEYLFFNRLSPEDQQNFLLVKRANPYLNLGDVFAQPDPLNPGQTTGQLPVGIAPERKIANEQIITAPAVPGVGTRADGVVTAPPGADASGVPAPVDGAAPQAAQPIMPLASVEDLPPTRAEREAAAKARENKERGADLVIQEIDRALEMVGGSALPTTGIGGSLLKGVPGTAAHDISKLLDTVRSEAAFGRLQQMREASPTGGALGQVTEKELALLQAAIGSLEQSQSQPQFTDNLKRVRNLMADIIHGAGNGPPRMSLGFRDGAPTQAPPPTAAPDPAAVEAELRRRGVIP